MRGLVAMSSASLENVRAQSEPTLMTMKWNVPPGPPVPFPILSPDGVLPWHFSCLYSVKPNSKYVYKNTVNSHMREPLHSWISSQIVQIQRKGYGEKMQPKSETAIGTSMQ